MTAVWSIVGAAVLVAATVEARGQEKPPQRDPVLEALALDAADLPPDFAADTLIRIASSPKIVDAEWRRDLLDEAFMRAYSVREPYRRTSTTPIPPDSRQGADQLAFAMSLTRVSLQVRAAQLMAFSDRARARELFEWIDPDVAPAACGDALVPSVDEYYSALSPIARTTFGDDRGEALRFLSLYLWRAHLPSNSPRWHERSSASARARTKRRSSKGSSAGSSLAGRPTRAASRPPRWTSCRGRPISTSPIARSARAACACSIIFGRTSSRSSRRRDAATAWPSR